MWWVIQLASQAPLHQHQYSGLAGRYISIVTTGPLDLKIEVHHRGSIDFLADTLRSQGRHRIRIMLHRYSGKRYFNIPGSIIAILLFCCGLYEPQGSHHPGNTRLGLFPTLIQISMVSRDHYCLDVKDSV